MDSVSIWRSIQGDDPAIYTGDFGDERCEYPAWFDLALGLDTVRLMIHDGTSTSWVALDDEGLTELHRRVVIAREYINNVKEKGMPGPIDWDPDGPDYYWDEDEE